MVDEVTKPQASWRGFTSVIVLFKRCHHDHEWSQKKALFTWPDNKQCFSWLSWMAAVAHREDHIWEPVSALCLLLLLQTLATRVKSSDFRLWSSIHLRSIGAALECHNTTARRPRELIIDETRNHTNTGTQLGWVNNKVEHYLRVTQALRQVRAFKALSTCSYSTWCSTFPWPCADNSLLILCLSVSASHLQRCELLTGC